MVPLKEEVQNTFFRFGVSKCTFHPRSLARKSQLASSACAAFNNNLACMQEAQLFRVVILGNKEEGARARANMILGAR